MAFGFGTAATLACCSLIDFPTMEEYLDKPLLSIAVDCERMQRLHCLGVNLKEYWAELQFAQSAKLIWSGAFSPFFVHCWISGRTFEVRQT
ncbi:hypothetical protein HUJ04_009443 [Dendroctonus ponderosae]|nr:hypothetical protein HUJ04_009443 [Dendroctonus ponderosae]